MDISMGGGEGNEPKTKTVVVAWRVYVNSKALSI